MAARSYRQHAAAAMQKEPTAADKTGVILRADTPRYDAEPWSRRALAFAATSIRVDREHGYRRIDGGAGHSAHVKNGHDARLAEDVIRVERPIIIILASFRFSSLDITMTTKCRETY